MTLDPKTLTRDQLIQLVGLLLQLDDLGEKADEQLLATVLSSRTPADASNALATWRSVRRELRDWADRQAWQILHGGVPANIN